MDPLSVTLAVVSLTTAVKDIVEFGEKIHNSFAKVSNNLRSAQRVAGEIKEMVEEIRGFCEDHKGALDEMKDFRLALMGLLAEFRGFEVSILPLLPQPPQSGRRRRDFLIRGWWNNNKIHESILNLQSNIVTVMRRYMMKSAMRTEVKLETIQQETSKSLAGITQGLEIVRRDVSALHTMSAAMTTLRSYGSSALPSGPDMDRHIIMFAKSMPSASAPMLQTPDVITEDLVTAAYIKLQINSIAMTVEKMTIAPTSATNNAPSNSAAPFQLFPVLEQASMDTTQLRHYVVRQVIHIRDLLNTMRIQTISIQDGARALNRLSFGLEALGMSHESIMVGDWAITLPRMLFDAPSGVRQPEFGAMLALHLFNQSGRYSTRNGDEAHSLQAIKEAYTIIQDLQNYYGTNVDFQILYTDVLLQYARLVDNQQSIKMTIEAVQILEGILDVQAFNSSQSHQKIESVALPSPSFLNQLFTSERPIAITNYALALQRLGGYLLFDGLHESAIDLALLAIAIRRELVSVHGLTHKVNLAKALSLLVRGRTANCIPTEECINMADECIKILRELADKNPLPYAQELVDVLWVHACTLETLHRHNEAITTWEDIVTVTGQIRQDSELCAHALGHLSDQFRHLRRHDDALRTGLLAITTYHADAEIRALRYLYLSKDLQQLGRYKESIEAAQTSVALCRYLAISDPGVWMGDLAEGLSHLAHCLAASGDHSEALIAWKESVGMLDAFLNASQDESTAVIGGYLEALHIHTLIGFILEDEEECIKIYLTAGQYLHQLAEKLPRNADTNLRLLYLWSAFDYADNLLRLGYLQDAQRYIDRWLDVWSRKPAAILDVDISAVHAAMVLLKADVLDAQGCTRQALLTTRTVHDIVELSMCTDQSSFSQLIDSMINEAKHQVSLGNAEQALQVVEEALLLSRKNKLQPIIENLVWSLHAVSLIALLCQNYKRANEAAQEGCNISSRSKWRNSEAEHNVFIRPSLFAILSAAEANLGRCDDALVHAEQAVSMSLTLKGMKAYVSATTAERSYMETRENLAEVLLAMRDLEKARQICEERRVYFLKRVEKRMGEYRELAPILRMLGILCCREGRHEEGEAVASKLSQILKMLGRTFPSLQEQVKIRLRNQAKVPILKILNDLCERLDCGHQTDIVSLYET